MSTHDNPDRTTELLSQALSEEAAMVEPTPGALQAIQQRTTKKSPARNRWVLGTFGAGLATAAVITAVVVAGNNGGPDTGRAPAVTQPSETTVEQELMHDGVYDPNADPSEQFAMHYVGPNPTNPELTPRLFAETHTVSEPGDDAALTAVNEFLTSRPIDPDYSSGWPEGTYATDIRSADGVTTIDLAGDLSPESMAVGTVSSPPRDGVRRAVALQGLIATLGADEPVAFTYNGEPVDMLLSQDVSTPVSIASEIDVRSLLTIDTIVEGQTVSSPLTVTVSGNTYEGNVIWTLEDADTGATLDESFVTTSMGMWTAADIELGDLSPGDYTLTVQDTSGEGGDTSLNSDDKTFTVE